MSVFFILFLVLHVNNVSRNTYAQFNIVTINTHLAKCV